MKGEDVSNLYIAQAKQLEDEGKFREAERLVIWLCDDCHLAYTIESTREVIYLALLHDSLQCYRKKNVRQYQSSS